MSTWFKHSFWRNLVDMHIPDWNPLFMTNFSAAKYAENMQTAEVDTSELYTGNCLGICFWPTRAGHMHAGLKGQDIVGPTLALLQQKGLITSSGSSLSAFPYENTLFLSAFPTFSRTPKRFKSNATLVV